MNINKLFSIYIIYFFDLQNALFTFFVNYLIPFLYEIIFKVSFIRQLELILLIDALQNYLNN